MKAHIRCSQRSICSLIGQRCESYPIGRAEGHQIRTNEVQAASEGDDEDNPLTTVESTRFVHDNKHVIIMRCCGDGGDGVRPQTSTSPGLSTEPVGSSCWPSKKHSS